MQSSNGSALFLSQTLNMSSEVVATETQLGNRTRVKLISRGIVEIIPFHCGGKDIIISAGVHGDETGPMELVDRIITDILNENIVLQHRCLFILAHPEATNQFTRFVGENLNRLFGERHVETNKEHKIANYLQTVVTHFYAKSEVKDRWHLDLHCAIRDSEHYTFAVSPHTANDTRSNELGGFLQASKIEALMLSTTASPTFSWYSAQNFSAQALTMELGKVAKIGENDLASLNDFDQGLRKLICAEQVTTECWDNSVKSYQVSRTLTKRSDEFKLTFPNNQANFSFFPQGHLLATDIDSTQYHAIEGGEAVVFPNADVAINQRAALLVKPVQLEISSDQLKVIES
ncbi:MAG: succinylglutamate desuccinylase [Aliivibrio sp.]|uniref:succinylglutamate desuccinylase n=1 Tax=Aliivibrio sp. TaxID=1872443 RepID=UPI001A5D46F5|nr:succinylglutamate desuccinylase [Aliivibrio sp.]